MNPHLETLVNPTAPRRRPSGVLCVPDCSLGRVYHWCQTCGGPPTARLHRRSQKLLGDSQHGGWSAAAETRQDAPDHPVPYRPHDLFLTYSLQCGRHVNELHALPVRTSVQHDTPRLWKIVLLLSCSAVRPRVICRDVPDNSCNCQSHTPFHRTCIEPGALYA